VSARSWQCGGQGFESPGSDLASLKLRATGVDGGWVLSGQKIWTTHAHIAHWGLCLARTGTQKRHGLSMFIIDMHNPAVEVRPIKQANDESEFNEVFFNDVFVPAEMLIGQPGEGWSLAMETLAYERLFIGGYIETGNERRLQKIVQAKSYAGSREAALQALGHVSAYGTAIAAMNLRETLRRLDGQGPGPATSISKAAASMLHVDAAAAALNLIGPAAALSETRYEPVFHELDIPTWVIGGGTLEIQLNTIASFVLDLPRR
jgi:3-oxochol-4-en-24-oyl-CoA dehydrogenase